MIVIHHNPDCGTSRNVLAIIEKAGYEPVIVDYLQEGWSRSQLLALFAAADLTPRSALRTTKSPAQELGLLADDVSDAQILDAMLRYPVLVNRPIVQHRKGLSCAGLVNRYWIYSIGGRQALCTKKMEN